MRTYRVPGGARGLRGAPGLCVEGMSGHMTTMAAMPPPLQSPFREEDSDSDASEDSAGGNIHFIGRIICSLYTAYTLLFHG